MAKLHIKKRFGVAPDELLNNKEISWKAKGLYAYIQSKPDGWNFAIERFEGKDGKDSTRAGVMELERFGYLLRERVRQQDGTFDIEYTLFEEPHHGGKPATDEDATMAENPTAENPTAENPPSNKDIPTKTESEKHTLFADFWEIYPKKEGKQDAEKAWKKLSEKERDAAFAALPNHIRLWRQKYGQPNVAKFPTNYVKGAGPWLNGRRWEDVLDFTLAPKPRTAEEIAEAKRREEAYAENVRREKEERERKDREAAQARANASAYFRTLSEEQQRQIRDKADKELERFASTKERFPEQYRLLRESKIIAILKQEFSFTI